MAKKLTEEMVIARTKISDLGKIKRLNCWGSELEDVSLLRRMPCVEVLSLSINKINTLADFQFCQRLEELYIRQNDIRDVNQVMYLQCLPNLKNLWLGENPCATIDGYRLAVIRALPQLQKLDNVQITPEENRDAQRSGKILSHPEDSQDESEEEYVQTTMPIQRSSSRDRYSENEGSPTQISPRRRDESRVQQPSDYEDVEGSEEMYPCEDASEESRGYSPPRTSSPRKQEVSRRTYSPEQEYVDRRSVPYDRESPPPPPRQQYYEKSSPTNTSSYEADTIEVSTNFRETKLVNSQSASCIKEYSNGNGDKYGYHSGSEYCVTHVPSERPERPKERYTCPAAHRSHYTRRPVTRNSNILSAVLCLVKELDYPSLEVVEMAVRCRMDEMAD
ncbi:cilia- and flagella-associated protein 410 isoform X1 [Diorhabda carinulata]|uniref:cilia- and flagella-associated protein 410 isoform X1 n=1 Tax=Diorhabda sublineata TaxID=1163346 RepID=UPI0024E05BB2|nr:cilia- and flagella-associated protein 410 isoform X1 [Diorhabda sublineata]XP_057657037.1 cilia- and flagella-associated protein 410 isoform X1 [Diorhabda carinulata]